MDIRVYQWILVDISGYQWFISVVHISGHRCNQWILVDISGSY